MISEKKNMSMLKVAIIQHSIGNQIVGEIEVRFHISRFFGDCYP
ncbi:hypothetical protein [Clostridium argentinense]|nr:hypothetical protein [Clostridium argentinense]